MPVRQTPHALGASRRGCPSGTSPERVPLHCRARCELDTGNARLHHEPGTATIVSRPDAALHACLRADAHQIERERADHDQNRESLGEPRHPAKGCLDQRAYLLSFAVSAIFSLLLEFFQGKEDENVPGRCAQRIKEGPRKREGDEHVR